MRFWQKNLIITLSIFMVVLDIVGVTMINKSMELTIYRELEQANGEIALLSNTLHDKFAQFSLRGIPLSDETCYDLAKSYDRFYDDRDIHIFLKKDGVLIYPTDEIEFTVTKYDTHAEVSFENHSQIISDTSRYFTASMRLPEPYSAYELTYLKNTSRVYASHHELGEFFILMNMLGGLALMLIMLVAIKGLTRPLSLLNQASRKISADGGSADNIDVRAGGEIGELIDSFNRMNESIKRQMGDLAYAVADKERISESLAHELRTPMTSIHGFAEFLLSAKGTEEDKLIACEFIMSETNRLSRLITKILDISRMKSLSSEHAVINVSRLFAACMDKLSACEIDCIVEKLVLNETVRGDFDLLLSFLMNCIENSLHANSSKIQLFSYESDKVSVIEIRDNGRGMDQEFLCQALEPFAREDKSRSREHGGAGLGLTLCKQIADVHSATMTIESLAGKGTRVRFLQPNRKYVTTP